MALSFLLSEDLILIHYQKQYNVGKVEAPRAGTKSHHPKLLTVVFKGITHTEKRMSANPLRSSLKSHQ